MSERPRQASLRRLEQYSIRPNRLLGQNFLVDNNILDVIGRLADLEGDDVVLEVGGGLGVLSEYLAPRVAHLHVVEIDRALEAPLADALAPHRNATLHMTDALKLDYSALSPAPNKVVGNLPYGVAATVLLQSISDLANAKRWVAMVQREVAERLAAGPGSKTYGATSVLAQLACDVRIDRRLAGTVFHPVPRVESALTVLTRTGPAPAASLRTLVHAAFAHRRKALAGSLALAGGAASGLREAARTALVEIGRRPDARPEALTVGDFRALAAALGAEWLEGLSPR